MKKDVGEGCPAEGHVQVQTQPGADPDTSKQAVGVQIGHTRLMQDFYVKAYRQDMWADLLDVALAFLRNGAAYGLLIAMAIRGELTAAEFVLYFTAVSGFAQHSPATQGPAWASRSR